MACIIHLCKFWTKNVIWLILKSNRKNRIRSTFHKYIYALVLYKTPGYALKMSLMQLNILFYNPCYKIKQGKKTIISGCFLLVK